VIVAQVPGLKTPLWNTYTQSTGRKRHKTRSLSME
jgi:hypothetical protein